MKKKIMFLLLIVLMTVNVLSANLTSSDNFDLIQGDSVFIVDVQWQKITDTEYKAMIVVDLNYFKLMNPLTVDYAIVETYQWRNWFRPEFNIREQGRPAWYIDENGNTVNTYYFNYYKEVADTGEILNCEDNWRCDVPQSELKYGYYGLPFYISEVEFTCDANSKDKGYVAVIPSFRGGAQDIVKLMRPAYEGLPLPEYVFETDTVPLGWVQEGEGVRYYDTVNCHDMTSTGDAKLYFKLRPNPDYRHYNPDYEESKTWDYSDIISSLSSVANSNSLPFNMNIEYDFSGEFWDYTVSNETANFIRDNYYGLPDEFDRDCEIYYPSSDVVQENLKFSELTTAQQSVVNTGREICSGEMGLFGCKGVYNKIYCGAAITPALIGINEKLSDDYNIAVSIQQQKVINAMKDSIDIKLSTKKFLSRSIIPFFAFITLLIFYMIELIILGLVFLGLIPMMFNQFRRGLVDAFDIDDLLKKNHGVRLRGKK